MFHRQTIQEWEDYDDDGWAEELQSSIANNSNAEDRKVLVALENQDDDANDEDDDATSSSQSSAQNNNNIASPPPALFRTSLNQLLSSKFSNTGCFIKLNWSSPRVRKKRFFL